MTATRGVAIVVLIAVVGLAIAPLASAGLSDTLTESTEGVVIDQDDVEDEKATGNEAAHGDDNENTESAAGNGSSPGTNVTEFMQSNAAETESTVETGLFNASYNNADDESREAIVTDRAETIENRIADLETEKNELEENQDEMSPAAYDARMTRLTVKIHSLEDSIDTVEQRAVDMNLNMSGLNNLRSSAEDLAGPTVAEIATNLVGVDLSNGFSDGIQEQVSESVPSPDLGGMGSSNVTEDVELPSDNLSNAQATGDAPEINSSAELEPDTGDADELIADENTEEKEIEDSERGINENGTSEDNENGTSGDVLEGEGERVTDIDGVVDDGDVIDDEDVIDESTLEEENDENATPLAISAD